MTSHDDKTVRAIAVSGVYGYTANVKCFCPESSIGVSRRIEFDECWPIMEKTGIGPATAFFSPARLAITAQLQESGKAIPCSVDVLTGLLAAEDQDSPGLHCHRSATGSCVLKVLTPKKSHALDMYCCGTNHQIPSDFCCPKLTIQRGPPRIELR